MTRDDYEILFKKYLEGKASREEEELLLKYEDGLNIQQFDDGQPIDSQFDIQQRIFDRIEKSRDRPVRRFIYKQWLAIAASILLILAAALFGLNPYVSKRKAHTDKFARTLKPIVPGGNKATLTLSNGATVDLNEAANGLIAKSGNVAVTKKQNGQIIYTPESGKDGKKGYEVLYNTITTPRGGQYQLVLPDGTSVWLNAASSLKYPVRFTNGERHVELTGEAYFEVAKNKNKPFRVSANNVDIKVLGTHFNVMSYTNEATVSTTLLEGSVLVSKHGKQAFLVPGQQADVEADKKSIRVREVDTEDAVSWKNGYFTFRHESMESIMKKVARWYDVDILYKDNLSQVVFGGSISRTKNIDELLKKIELTGSVHFKIEGRRVIVRK